MFMQIRNLALLSANLWWLLCKLSSRLIWLIIVWLIHCQRTAKNVQQFPQSQGDNFSWFFFLNKQFKKNNFTITKGLRKLFMSGRSWCIRVHQPLSRYHWWCLQGPIFVGSGGVLFDFGCVPNRILLLFTRSVYCSCPHKVHTVACSMHTIGTYYSVMIVRLELWLWCVYIHRSCSAKTWSTSWARMLSKTF